jgi:hypothetical protein
VWKRTTLAVVRDLLSFGLGAWGVIYEELTGRTSIPLLVLYATLLGVPGAAGAMWLLRIDGQPSPPPEEHSPPSPPTRRSGG